MVQGGMVIDSAKFRDIVLYLLKSFGLLVTAENKQSGVARCQPNNTIPNGILLSVDGKMTIDGQTVAHVGAFRS